MDGRADIFCGTDTGDDPTFSIMVNGDSLLETSMNVTRVNVTVASPGPWDIACSVRNRVSDHETRITAVKCPGKFRFWRSVAINRPCNLSR